MDEYEERLLMALTRDRQEIRGKISPENRNQLDALLDLAAEGGEERRQRAVAVAVAAHLRAALPEQEVLAVHRRFSDTVTAPPHELLARLTSFSGRSAALHGAGSAAADGEDALPSPYERLLAEPALSEDDLRENLGVEATAPELIRLRRSDGTETLPAFQFHGDGRPRDVVVAINRMLGAQDDPWGVADWWLGPNPWLATSPASLLGAGLDGQLLAAASVVGEED
ncbi:DUF3168 domain-containing protein [Streptomyces sp. NPDC089424]|uniref:DUF3168 domain-containing protein n=1 Tax=Streptomyces sp. NPDC089424 TaxID=3365917 RepID=UPI00380CA101